MAETKPSETAVAVNPGTEEDAVALPGQDEEEKERNPEFDRSALNVASAASGIPREKWGSQTQFLMSCIASAVGLGNVWRFPAICAKNGGAAFLFPYIIVLFVIARPLFILELSLGQFSSKGSVRCWDLCPMFRGIGVAGSVSSVLLSTFYIMLMAWALCYSVLCMWSMGLVTPRWGPGAETCPFFGGEFLQAPQNGFADPKVNEHLAPIWWLCLALVVAWLIIWATMAFGVEASGKVAYVTALAPYFVLIILLIVGFFLPGMEIGYIFLFVPEWKKLLLGKTWYEAVGQCFFSMGIGFGGCIMFSSFNEFHHPIFRDVLIVSIVDFLTSLLASCSLMAILGFQATEDYEKAVLNPDGTKNDTKIEEQKANCERGKDETSLKICILEQKVGETGGAGLAFVQYPAAMSEIQKDWGRPCGGLIGLLFFLMLILLAIGSANGFVGTTVTILSDFRPKWKRMYIVTGVCAFSCFCGFIYTNGVGSEWFDLVDMHGVTAVVYLLSFLEVIAVVYVYGLKNWCNDLEYLRNGKPVGWYLMITWVCLPFLLLGIFIFWLVQYKFPKTWTIPIRCIAWILTSCCIMVVPGVAIYQYVSFKKNPWRKNVSPALGVVQPSPRWGPKDPQIRAGWKLFKAERDSSYFLWPRFVQCICCKKEQTFLVSQKPSYATKYDPTAAPTSAAISSEDSEQQDPTRKNQEVNQEVHGNTSKTPSEKAVV